MVQKLLTYLKTTAHANQDKVHTMTFIFNVNFTSKGAYRLLLLLYIHSYIGCASKTPIGKQQKIRGNEHATISCSGGCLHFTKVMANAHPRPHYAIFMPQAMFVCSNIATIMHPSDAQKIINKKHLKLMKEKCEGKEFCSVQACDSWWNTNHNCPSHESPIMWINFHCNGIPGGAMVTREVGSCGGGT